MSALQIVAFVVLVVICAWCILRAADKPRGFPRRGSGPFISNYTERQRKK